MKKLFLLCSAILVILIMLTACKSNKGSISEDASCQFDSIANISSNDSYVVPDAQYIRTGYSSGTGSRTYTIISSVNELTQYFRTPGRGSNWETEYRNLLSKYSDEYFNGNFLVIVFLIETSGSNRHNIERVDRNGDIIINQIRPDIGTADMAAWNIIIELDNSFRLEQFQVVLR